MSKMKGAIVVNTDRCKGCQLCIVACPKDVIALAQKKVNVHGYPYTESARPDDCIGCAACATVVLMAVSQSIVKKWRNNLWQNKM